MAKLLRVITLQVPAGKANPAPPIGTALGPTGIPIQDFCKQFNDQTSSMEPGMVVTVKISIFDDRSFKFIIKSSPASVLIKKALGLGKGSAKPHTDKVGTLTKSQLEEIAKAKMEDLNANDIEAAMKIIAGAARSMGVKVEA